MSSMASPFMKEESMEYQNVHAPHQECGASSSEPISHHWQGTGVNLGGTLIIDRHGNVTPNKGLTDAQKKDVARAVQDGKRAAKQGLNAIHKVEAELKANGLDHSMGSDPGGIGSFQGLGKVTTFNGCHNLHIGNTNIITNYNSSGGGRRPAPKTRHVDEELQRLTNEAREVTEKEVDALARNIGREWRRLGRYLELTDAQLDGFHFNHNVEGLYEICYQMIRHWKSSNRPNASVKSVVKALISMDKMDIARRVFLTPP